MKISYSDWIKQAKTPPFWLLTIGSGLIAIHLTLAWRADESNVFGTGFLFWAAISSMIWQRRDQLKLKSSVVASLIGVLILSVLLLKSSSIPLGGKFLAILPFLSAFSLALLASGFKGLKQYWGELLALFFLAAPKVLEPWLVDISLLTAKLSAFLLWYGGFDAVRSGVFINLPKGGVEVYSACSGMDTIIHLLGIAFLYLLMFPSKPIQKIFIPLVAGIIAFITNGFRVAVMTVLVAGKKPEAFAYWHHGEGSLLFSILAVLLFGGFCWLLLQQEDSEEPEDTMRYSE